MLDRPARARRFAIGGLAAAVSVVVAGCGSVPFLATPVPPDALHPAPPAIVAQRTAAPPADPVKVGELDRHRQQWDATGIRDYSMTVIYGCECALAGRPITVQVVGGQLAAASSESGAAVPLDTLTGFPATVDALFAYGERFANAGKIEFAWDDHLGYPTAIGVDPNLEARDDEVRIAVLDLTP